MSFDFQEKILALLDEQGKTKKSLYDFLGLSRQGFDAMLKNNTISAVKLAEIAEFFAVDVSHFYGTANNSVKKSSLDKGAFGQDVLDALQKYFEEELRAKNAQIAGMQRTIDALVGKYDDVTVDRLLTPRFIPKNNRQRANARGNMPRYVAAKNF
ncbi:hypothetical protein [Arsenicibacter rosenii]|uniref:Uncharacterized protein n=1 Tax=Arsenicibacter rosenii TaxID=1750698 RepID=A0A1S2VLW3_9BACT|nr:hypothetical protein [Arsenicibacter rosenii]OIN59767.1 hypothetical protein BLX24_07885 [Arsenicibacter rosenii]